MARKGASWSHVGPVGVSPKVPLLGSCLPPPSILQAKVDALSPSVPAPEQNVMPVVCTSCVNLLLFTL